MSDNDISSDPFQRHVDAAANDKHRTAEIERTAKEKQKTIQVCLKILAEHGKKESNFLGDVMTIPNLSKCKQITRKHELTQPQLFGAFLTTSNLLERESKRHVLVLTPINIKNKNLSGGKYSVTCKLDDFIGLCRRFGVELDPQQYPTTVHTNRVRSTTPTSPDAFIR